MVDQYFDSSRSLKKLENIINLAVRLTALVETLLRNSRKLEGSTGENEEHKAHANNIDLRVSEYAIPSNSEVSLESKPWRPKTAKTTDSMIYPSERIREIIDVGDLLEHLEQEVWQML